MVLPYIFLILGLFLLLLTLIIEKPAVIFTLGIFLLLIVPFVQPLIGLIPNIGDDIQNHLNIFHLLISLRK